MRRVSVRVPTPLRDYADQRDDVEVEGETVAAALGALVERYPRLRRHLMAEDGALRSYVNIYLNEDDVRHMDGPATAVGEGDVITIVPSIAGGEALPGAEGIEW